jgi:hypothetical protein
MPLYAETAAERSPSSAELALVRSGEQLIEVAEALDEGGPLDVRCDHDARLDAGPQDLPRLRQLL